MDRQRRRWIILGLVTILGLVLLGRGALLSDDVEADRGPADPPILTPSVAEPAADPSLAVKGAATPETLLPVRSGYSLKGRVFDEATRDGIAAAQIVFRETHADRLGKEALTHEAVSSKEDGSFALEGVPSGKITVSVSAKEYAFREVDVVVDETTSTVEVGLSAGGRVSGYLTAPDGTPLVGSITLNNTDQHRGFVHETNEAGEFSFKQLAAGRYRLTGRADVGLASREIVLGDNERVEGIVLRLGKGRSVRGIVRGVEPEHFNQVFVMVRPGGKRDAFTSKLDDQGAYAVNGVPPGRALLEVHFSTDRELNKTVQVPADADLTVDVDLGGGVRLSGRVTHAGKLVSGATVFAWPVEEQDGSTYHSETSANGTYDLKGVIEGEYTLSVENGAGVVRRVRVSGDTVFDVDMALTQLAGRVFEEGSTVPIVGAEIHVVGAKREPLIRVYKESDHSGQFDVAGFDAADVLISVYKPGYEMFRERIASGSPATEMAFRLRRSSGVELRIRRADGGAAPRDVFLSETIGDTDGIGLWLHLDEEGIASLPSALGGSRLSFAASGHKPVVIDKWDARPLDLRVTPR